MLHLLSLHDGGAAAHRQLLDGLDRHLRAVIDSKGRGDLDQVARAEAEVSAAPQRAIRLASDGHATVHAAGRRYQGGRFEIPCLHDLSARVLRARALAGRPQARLRLFVFDGASPATDIGALQATAPPAALFQVASQFNCLESPGRFVTPVADYIHDPTQGPRASISAFPGTLVRHYAAPLQHDGDDNNGPGPRAGRFVQTSDGPQINLLADLCAEGVAEVRSGYLRAEDVTDPRAFARASRDLFGAIRIGLHDGIEIVLGHDWDGAVEAAPHRTVAQVLTSTIAAGLYGDLARGTDQEDDMALICRQLQRAAYLGTLLSAAALGKEYAVLTLIGGGVFGNPLPVIWEAILWAADQIEPLLHQDLVVVVNGRNLGEVLPPERLHAAAQARGGTLIRFGRSGASLPIT